MSNEQTVISKKYQIESETFEIRNYDSDQSAFFMFFAIVTLDW